jgi:hypothetical protein
VLLNEIAGNVLLEKVNPNTAKLMMQKVAMVAPRLAAGGFDVTGENIASADSPYTPEMYDQAYQWFTNKGKNPGVEYGAANNTPRSQLDRLVATIEIMVRRRKPGIDSAVAISGMSQQAIEELVRTQSDKILSAIPNFKPGWLKERSKSKFTQAEWMAKPVTERKAALRAAMEDLAGGRPGTVSSENIATRTGMERRYIDKLLSNEKDLLDLEKYRKVGRSAGTTDHDRELRAMRELKKRNYEV